MPKPPEALGAETQKNFLTPIILRNSASFKLLSQKDSPQNYPALPEHLGKSSNLPWNPDPSRQVDLWLWYFKRKLETVGGKF